MSEVNINYHFDAFERASEIISKSITALEKKAPRQQIAAMAMCAILSNPIITERVFSVCSDEDKIARCGTWESNPYVFVYDFELVGKGVSK